MSESIFQADWPQRICHSFQHWAARDAAFALALPGLAQCLQPEGLDQAEFPVLAHVWQSEPVFVYANARALACFGYAQSAFIGMASRLSAEPVAQSERAALLERVMAQGWSAGYRGVRIRQDGRRFKIVDALLWNVLDESGQVCGQAAAIGRMEDVGSE